MEIARGERVARRPYFFSSPQSVVSGEVVHS